MFPTYDPIEQKVIRYLGKKYLERHNESMRSRRGVEKVEIIKDCQVTGTEYASISARLTTLGLLEIEAQGCVGEFVVPRPQIIELVRHLDHPPVPDRVQQIYTWARSHRVIAVVIVLILVLLAIGGLVTIGNQLVMLLGLRRQ